MFNLNTYIRKTANPAPLVVFRVCFGFLMAVSLIIFWQKGWIESLYLEPKFHFTFYAFSWVKPLGVYTYALFAICALSSVFVALGFKYRIAMVTFFLSFAYIQFMDKTVYQSSSYFIMILSFLMIFLPANAAFSIDSLRSKRSYRTVPKWCLDSVKFIFFIVFFYSGLAKLNSDWLFRAMPLELWLTSSKNIPFIGASVLQSSWFHYTVSWSFMIFELALPFLLLYKRTQLIAFILLIGNQLFSQAMFPLGMFPLILVFSAPIFFSSEWHQKALLILRALLSPFQNVFHMSSALKMTKDFHYVTPLPFLVVSLFFVFQLLFPLRYMLYEGELFWTGEGYLFSWRTSLIEKSGTISFKVVNPENKEVCYVDNSEFLTERQEQQMSFQPDFILEYAHYLAEHYKSEGYKYVAIYADSFVTLNGRPSKRFINPEVNLVQEEESFSHKKWILPFHDKISGL
ncbi:vitamin K-dependent gamma-carboxylase [Formosa agariphila KMM 3901]|uniref:Vitamin K-dependent gamma-carboxylase n=1 Tax=Formosa agariphila (strain DSM 15362 / KCTC 12365 / LMG 23005 / KMM 3901 / M-2Alg 35-1) TaxID=1347342 RepID=T2KIF5_FORAG|nr:HTTM domain-containing protein [Formosa agariphila]CDF78585.1 vitamin K-dependent gamma-carboxylase [Formosa agariphila KMM 3901]